MKGVVLDGNPETPRKLQELARHEFICKMLSEILTPDTKPVHSGNVEYLAGHGYTTDREYCERMAKALNGEFDNPGA